jgi:glycosyltransferase involved in cell wall biosynthesis
MSAFPGHPIKVIPNGVAIPDTIEHIEAGEVLRLLFIGRLDPKKGLENLFEACAKLRADGERKWTLTVAGLGEPSYTKELESIVKTLELKQRVAFVGDVRGSEKAAVFAGSDLTIVPSHIENFGVVVAESLAHGVPVIASRGTPWSRLEEMRCGLWVDNHPGTLAEAIIRMRNLPLIEMGANGRAWMRREFAWSSVAKDLLDLYQEVAG